MGYRRVLIFLWIAVAVQPFIVWAEPTIDLQLVTAGVTNPVYVTNAGDGSGRLFIVEQGGLIKIFDGAQLRPTLFADLRPVLRSGGEQGLLSVAFHPGYATNGQFYVYYTDPASNLVVASYMVSADPNVANTNSAVVRLIIPHPINNNHNGGQLQFGPDGYLYFATGDGGSACDPPNNAQNLNSLLGKMLRIDINTNESYRIPPTNPFTNDGDTNTLAEIWVYGLRNPWRFSFDRLTGDLIIGDVGQENREEVDFQSCRQCGWAERRLEMY